VKEIGCNGRRTLCSMRSEALERIELEGTSMPLKSLGQTLALLLMFLTMSGAARAVDVPWLAGITVVDQHGVAVDVRSDLAARQVVVMNFTYTTSTAIGPQMGAIFGQLLKLLGPRAGGDVSLVTVSVDPVTDTPQRMSAWVARFGAGPGWSFWTGAKDDINKLLKMLKVFTPDFSNHAQAGMIFHRDGTVTRFNALTPAGQILKLIDQGG
jgi:protein SCO1/2